MIKLNVNILVPPTIKRQTKESLTISICLICMVLFASNAYFKIVDHERFLHGISRINYIGNYAHFISWLVPSSELLISLLLISPLTQKWGLYGFIGLMLAFTFYIMSMLFWTTKLPCHCGGAIESLSWVQHIWFNLGFIVLASIALWLSSNLNKKQNEKS